MPDPSSPDVVSITDVLASLTFEPNRIPTTDTFDWAATVANYRDGGIFVVHYAGSSAWERHPGDEIVMVLDGATTMTMLIGADKVARELGPQQLVIVPERTWHRFDTPDEVKVMTVTPQPTDHSIEHPLTG